ncbi:hypothetical protein VP01_2627g2 [Puccinia sorghi]|uniref:Velvet domain-containing protein n=1 Tax=Puccinia sorghi TaxID=27349 RepID=A0A0L6V4F2_9BASI|nr:hypothetical protein VP01_2627g2 [Puccinia sorghi]
MDCLSSESGALQRACSGSAPFRFAITSEWVLQVIQQPEFGAETPEEVCGPFGLGLPIAPAPVIETALDYCDPESPIAEIQWLFIFGDIGVKSVGRYVLRFALYRLEDSSTEIAHTYTDPHACQLLIKLHVTGFTPLSARLKQLYPQVEIHSPKQPRIFPDTDSV